MSERRGRLVPVVLFVLLAALSVALWRGQLKHRRELLESYAETIADQASIRMQAWFEARMAALSVLTGELAHDLETQQGVDEFDALAAAFYQAQPGFQAINWLDPSGVVLRVVPEDRNPGVLGFNIREHPESMARFALERAVAETTVTLTNCLSLLQGGEGFASYWPVLVHGGVAGFVNGVFRLEQSIRAALAAGVFADFHVALSEDEQVIFKTPGWQPPRGAWFAERWITIPHGHPWRMTLTPRPSLAEGYGQVGTHLLLLFTLTVSAVLAWLARALILGSEMARAAHEEALRELAVRKRLEVERNLTIAELEQANRALEQANQELDAYIYAASHDVRAPLVAVAGLVDILLEPDGSVDPAERQHIIGRVRHNIRKLDSLVQDMLIVSRSRRLERTSEIIDIAAVCEEVWSSVKDLGGDLLSEIRMDIAPGRVFRSDPLRFRQIMNNLLSNAVKYRDLAKASLHVEVAARLEDGPTGRAQLEMSVRDNGLGVPAASVPHVFDMFYKASPDAFGSGLGLYIVRQHCRALGGEVTCHPLPGGTEFRVVLPGDA